MSFCACNKLSVCAQSQECYRSPSILPANIFHYIKLLQYFRCGLQRNQVDMHKTRIKALILFFHMILILFPLGQYILHSSRFFFATSALPIEYRISSDNDYQSFTAPACPCYLRASSSRALFELPGLLLSSHAKSQLHS